MQYTNHGMLYTHVSGMCVWACEYQRESLGVCVSVWMRVSECKCQRENESEWPKRAFVGLSGAQTPPLCFLVLLLHWWKYSVGCVKHPEKTIFLSCVHRVYHHGINTTNTVKEWMCHDSESSSYAPFITVVTWLLDHQNTCLIYNFPVDVCTAKWCLKQWRWSPDWQYF